LELIKSFRAEYLGRGGELMPNAAILPDISDPGALTVFAWVVGALFGVMPGTPSSRGTGSPAATRNPTKR
jgi:hypothetical protein